MASAFLAVFRGSRKGGKYEPCRSFGMRKPSWTEPRVGCGDRPLARCPNEPRAGEDSRPGFELVSRALMLSGPIRPSTSASRSRSPRQPARENSTDRRRRLSSDLHFVTGTVARRAPRPKSPPASSPINTRRGFTAGPHPQGLLYRSRGNVFPELNHHCHALRIYSIDEAASLRYGEGIDEIWGV
jgi:hypothetical protein